LELTLPHCLVFPVGFNHLIFFKQAREYQQRMMSLSLTLLTSNLLSIGSNCLGYCSVLESFHLHKSRKHSAGWSWCALTIFNSPFTEANQKGMIVTFAERLEESIEATCILNSKKRKRIRLGE
ncbi:MAG: hypothetical protein Q8941_23115, partial [Bacteroidota bacterium]|nr:hypothetical protein [Bacteroidota bacterium]